MNSFGWFLFYLYTSIGFHNSHQYGDDDCSNYPDFMVTVNDITSDRTDGSGTRTVRSKIAAAAVILSDRWILTTSEISMYSDDTIVQFGTSSFEIPSSSNSRYIKSKVVLKKLALIEVNETFPFNTSYSKSVKAAKLPPSIGFASQCSDVAFNGWRGGSSFGAMTISPSLYCYHGSRSSNCSSTETEITFPYDKCTFCFKGKGGRTLRMYKGNAVFCNNDVLIGITYDDHPLSSLDENIVEISHYMTWIGKTTGIKVAYQSEPKTTTEKPTTRQEWFEDDGTKIDSYYNAATSTMNNFLIVVSLILSLYRLIAY